MKKLAFIVGIVSAFSTMAVAADIAFYVGAPNVDGWYTVVEMNKNVATIIEQTGHLFKDIQQFNDSQFPEFNAWVEANTDDGEMDILWLNGCVPSNLYPFPNVQPDGSRIEAWLDGGNMVINVGDWFGYVSYEGGGRKTENGATGAANILDLSSGIILSADGTTLPVTDAGRQYLPSLNNPAPTARPIALSAVTAPWEVAVTFAQDATRADPLVIHNTVTNAYVAFINQSTVWVTDRGVICSEFIKNWVATVVGLGNPSLAADPVPDDEAVDVHADAVLSWLPGAFAAAHDVYFGTSFADVNEASRTDPKGVLVGQDQTDAEFDPDGLLQFGQTYYWRIDEVNGAPDNTIFKGQTWSFTAEPFAYPFQPVAATASSAQPGMGAQNAINGSGLNADDQHSVEATDMWMTNGAKPAWIQFEFDKVYKLHEMWVWNSNQLIEAFIGFGAKDVTIEYSTDGATWATLDGVPEFAKATATATYAANTTVPLGGVLAQFVKLTINANWGGVAPQTGLAEVRFFQIPVQAREPIPADGATGVSVATTMDWRPGREATSHKVFFGADEAAVADGTAAASTLTAHSYAPAAMEFGTQYFWKVDEVGDGGAYAGDVWSFVTQEFAPIDDFEAYTDDEGSRIYESWIDGVTTGASGSTVGYMQAPFAEQTIVHGGKQSMPLAYDHSGSFTVSEAELAFDTAQNWTTNGADSVVVNFRGQAPAFAELANGNIVMSAIGADIWNNADEFRYAYKTLNGDGTMVARVESVGQSDVWAKAGVMIRQSIEPATVHAFMPITASGGGGASFQHRLTLAGVSTNNDNTGTAVAAPYWVKIERKGNAFTGFISPDGKAWTQLGTAQTVTMTGPVLIGLALTSHNTTVTTAAEFSNIATTGNVTGAWQVADIGVAQPVGNSIEGLYLSVTDSGGKTKLLQHPDAAAAASVSWQQWKIPLSEFTSAGVKMNAVKSLVIGVGNKAAPKAGGTGLVFIDDIGYGRSAQ